MPPYPDDNDANRPYNPGPPPGYQGPHYVNQPAGQPYGNPPPNKGTNIWPWIAGAGALLLIIVLAVVFFTRESDDPAPLQPPVTVAPPPVSNTPVQPPVSTVPEQPPVSTVPPPANTVPSPRVNSDDDRFLRSLLITDSQGVDHSKFWSGRNRDRTVYLGYAICSDYDNLTGTLSNRGELIVQDMVNNGLPRDEASWVRAAAVVHLCPEYRL
jgi:hypothetical protein